MKKLVFLIFLIFSIALSAQKKKPKDIMQSTNIQEIENFLKTSRPDDPRRTALKPKLIALKNAAWMSGAKNAKPMDPKPIVVEVPRSVLRNPDSDEAEEFKKLITETAKEHSVKTVRILNALFNQDTTSQEAIVLIQNNSDCNMIVRINGGRFYNLAVSAHGENSLVLNKGKYDFTSNVCGSKYHSAKDIQKSIVVLLNNPVFNHPKKNN